MVFVQKSNILSCLFLGQIKQEKIVFFYVLDKKECFLDQKEEVLKNSKNIEIFKGSMVFVKQWNFYHLFFFFGKSIQKRVLWDISNKKECFLDKEKEVLQKSKNSIFSMVFVKKLNFLSSVVFWANQARKDRFFEILDIKECFLDQKIEVLKKFKKSKFGKMQFFRLF